MANSFLNMPGPLGLRNNNPGNLRPLRNGQKWEGEIAPDYANNFSRFSDVAWGLRAMITDIVGDIVNDGTNTIRKLVTAYAPPSDNNNTAAYIQSVANYMGMGADSIINPDRSTIERLVRAKLNVELGANNAARITQGDLNEGFDRLSITARQWLKNNAGAGSLILLGVGAYFLYKHRRKLKKLF